MVEVISMNVLRLFKFLLLFIFNNNFFTHVEAPICGSIILAGLLKLGGFGIYHILMLVFKVNLNFNYFLISLCLIGIIVLRLVCFFQRDLKILIAYSSVVHIGYFGSLILIFGHGLCSSGLFCLRNICYLRFKSRIIILIFLYSLYLYLYTQYELFCYLNSLIKILICGIKDYNIIFK
ncbi:hypothetical protein AGLY_017592 [Aphis glycines]|uniref:NADH-ubiquinone oxidoreductase chain 4 n=1 Tax=Aphis glycines TaxID=307491 RepID=A0A6G0SUS0_APHGL|nr:hypothetical protein AGLY_017592 [Aphis glycines]